MMSINQRDVCAWVIGLVLLAIVLIARGNDTKSAAQPSGNAGAGKSTVRS